MSSGSHLLHGGILLNLFHVCSDYVDYLRQFDARIYENRHKRPYVGVVCAVNGFDYYVPLSSPKPKHRAMSNAKDFHKIGNGAYGACNFNYMIPVHKNDLSRIDFSKEADLSYRALLVKQYAEIVKISNVIISKANSLYVMVQARDEDLTAQERVVKARCCDFLLLETLLAGYVNPKKT